jgi:hypothetical protein
MFQEVLQALNERYNHLICLSDLVDYGPSPRKVLQFLRERASFVVRGNHDWGRPREWCLWCRVISSGWS